jgi:hypothetical protein
MELHQCITRRHPCQLEAKHNLHIIRPVLLATRTDSIHVPSCLYHVPYLYVKHASMSRVCVFEANLRGESCTISIIYIHYKKQRNVHRLKTDEYVFITDEHKRGT